MESAYILVINGKPEGPFTIGQLKEFAIKPNDFVKTPAMPDYKEAHEILELREIFHFDKRSVAPQYFASFDQRLLASALDWFFVSVVFVALAVIAILFVTDKPTQFIITFSLLGIIPVTKIIYHIVMESSIRQATYGKSIVRIKVCDMEGKRLTIGLSIARNLLKIFSVVTVLGYLYSFFNKKQQCLHDVMAGTLVMKDRLF